MFGRKKDETKTETKKENKIVDKKTIASSILNDMKVEKKDDNMGLYKIVDTLLNQDNIKSKTIFTNDMQVKAIVNMIVLAQVYEISFFDIWTINYMLCKISGDSGKGRQDIVDITKFNYNEMQQQRNELLDIIRSK